MKADFIAERAAYNVMKKIYCDKAYSSIELDRALTSAPEKYRGRITALVYGVLEKSVLLDFVIASLAKNAVKNNVEVLLKMGLYETLFGNDPDYAVVNRYVAFARDRMPGTQGFVNAILRRAESVAIPTGDDPVSLSVRYSQPLWLVKQFITAYGLERTVSLLSVPKMTRTHIRRNAVKISQNKFLALLSEFENCDVCRTNMGYYVTHNILNVLKPDIFTPQSLASMYAVNIYAEDFLTKSPRVLDLCAAPGGKSVYFRELVPDAIITACDVHAHRVRLIEAYASRMGVSIVTEINDATVLRKDWFDKFDLVICDVPCTGSGLFVSSPDIMLFKSAADADSLTAIQYAILSAAARYVKPCGELFYSTCSLLPAENENVIDRFLQTFAGYEPAAIAAPYGEKQTGKTRLFPDRDGCDGFFIAKMRRHK